MSQPPATSDKGIRSIFATALDIPPPEAPGVFARLRDAIGHVHVGHALAGGTLGAGAAVAGFVLLALSAPRSVSADTTAFREEIPIATIAKGDRMPIFGRRFAASATASATEIDLGVPPSEGFTGSAMAYAALPLWGSSRSARDAREAIDANMGAGTQYASLGQQTLMVPGAAAAAADVNEGEDDEGDDQVVAIPRARPPHMEEAAPPMPRARPHYASVAPLSITGNAPEPQAEEDEAPPGIAERMEPPPAEPKAALGFFSSPTDPVKAPPRIKLDTPFGIPYVLQTASVETACLKPDMIELLHKIETKYGQKVVITSAARDRGRRGSMHRMCAAADIIVPGVSAEKLAAYARTIPGIGGVGTYCHSELVHVDTGTPRDWKYGCGSFFAMRGAPGKWGKVPASLAAAQPAGDAKLDLSQMAD